MKKETDTAQWIQNFLNNNSSPEEMEQLQEYFKQYGLTEDRPGDDPLYYPAEDQSERMHEAVMKAIGAAHFRQPLKLRTIPHWIRKVAAVLIPLIALATVLIYFGNTGKEQQPSITRIENTAQSVRYIRLSDSSGIWLNKGASISLDEKGFAANRHITLHGEAFFQVAHDALHPFSVQAGPVRTTVLGTSFSIRTASGDGPTIVALISGKVQVAEGSTSRILSPGEAVVYDPNSGSIQATELPFAFLTWKNKELKCKKEPLGNIIQYLNTYYGCTIRLRPGLEALTYSGSIALESGVSMVLNRLLFVHQLQYKIAGNDILIY